MSDDVTNPGEPELDAIDPIEDAWLQQDPELVEKLARERVAQDATDAHAHGWLGLALCGTGKTALGQAALTRAFELIRAKQSSAKDEDEQHQLTWALHGIANRLIDFLAENPTLGEPAASFVLDTLKFEHPPSLRLLAENALSRDEDAVKAATLLKRALAVDATDPESHYLAARVMARLGKKPPMLSHLQKALDNAAGTIAVRTLARYEPDFDGFRKDAEFTSLIDLFPKEEPLRAVYVALDQGELEKVVTLAEAAKGKVPNALDLLYPWREALEQLLDREGADEKALLPKLEAVQAEVEAHEEKDEESPVYGRFCGDA
jgi:tetratricopeptide (TPR) repeat protein